MAITFDPHPEQVLFPERKLTYLTGARGARADHRTTWASTTSGPVRSRRSWLGSSRTSSCAWSPSANRSPSCGSAHDFALGRGRRGSLAVLAEIGAAFGWALHIVPPQRYEGQVVSSTAIRTLLAAGAVRGAADLLGRTYSVVGEIDRRGCVDPNRALPRPASTTARSTPEQHHGATSTPAIESAPATSPPAQHHGPPTARLVSCAHLRVLAGARLGLRAHSD